VSIDPEAIPADFNDIPDPMEAVPAPLPKVSLPRLDPSSTPRAATRSRRAVAVVLSLGWFALHLAVYGIRKDLHELPAVYVAAQVLLPFGFAVTAFAVALNPGKLGLGANIGSIILLSLLGPASFLMIALGAPEPHVEAAPGGFWLGTLVCLDITLGWAAVPLLGAALALGRAFPASARYRSALVGAACGLFSGAVMNLHCPALNRYHIAIGHGVPVIVATLVAAFVASRWLRV
jgi:hypothetical protein